MKLRNVLLAVVVLCSAAFAQGPNPFILQFQQGGSTVAGGTFTKYAKVNFASGCTAVYSGGALNITCTGGAANPGGSANQIQVNNAGTSFNGISSWTSNSTTTITGDSSGILDLSALTISNIKFPSGAANLFYATPNGAPGAPTLRAIVAADIPTLNQSTTGNALTATSAGKWTTARNLAGNSVDGSANVNFSNAFIAQGTADSGLSGAQFLGALGTGIVKNTTTTGVLSIAVAGDFPTLNQNTTGSAAKWTTARNLAGNSVDGSANVNFANKFIVQGTTDSGLTNAQFLGALGTGILKNTTTTGVLSAAAAADVVGLFTGCSGVQYLGADSNCHTGGTGTATSVGLTGTANQITVTGGTPITTSGAWTLSLPSLLAIPGDETIPAANSLSFVGQSLFLAADANVSTLDCGSSAGGTDCQINMGTLVGTGVAAGSHVFKAGNGTCPTPTSTQLIICNNGGTGSLSISQNGGAYAGAAVLGAIPFDSTNLSAPTGNGSFTYPATNGFTLNGTAPVSTSSNGTNAGNLVTFNTPAGGATTGSATTGGTGGTLNFNLGAGGSASGGTNAQGGQGGGLHITPGAGGASSGSAANANGGDVEITAAEAGSNGGGAAGRRTRLILDESIVNAITDSPKFEWRGTYESAATPTFGTDSWTANIVEQAATVNGKSTLTFAQSGSSGVAAVSAPNLIATVPTAHGVSIFEGSSPMVSVTGAADAVFMGNDAGTGADPAYKALPTTGTNGCAGTSDVLHYNTSTHAYSCAQISGSGTVNSGTATHLAYYATTAAAVSDAGADLVFDGTHTYSASSSLVFNLASAPTLTGFKVPSAAGAVPTADGQLAFNTTNHTLTYGVNGVTGVSGLAATGTNAATTCSNQFISAVSGVAAPTCTTATLASAQFANQGTTTTVLHGNGAGNPAFGAVVNADITSMAESKLTGSAAATTITEAGTGDAITRAGVETANLTAPYVFQNTNSSNNNTSITLGITAPGTSTGQTVLNVNGAATGGDLLDLGTGGTWAAGVLSGQTVVAAVTAAGALKLGTAPTCTAGTGGGAICSTESSTDATGVSSTFVINGNSNDHAGHWSSNNGTVQHLPQTAFNTSYTNATTSFTSITGLSFAVAASTNYVMTCNLTYQGSATTTGLKVQVTGPASPTSVSFNYTQTITTSATVAATFSSESATAFSSAMGDTVAITATTNMPAQLTMSLANGTNAGTVQVQGAADGTGTVTVQPSSCILQ